MLLKQRTVPNELKIMRFLNPRMDLSVEEKRHHDNLEKGYKGEILFDQLTSGLKDDNKLIINDLRLLWNRNFFQIDTLIITQDMVYLFEVKYFEGDFYYEDNGFYISSRMEIQNPIEQLKRCKIYLKQLLNHLGFHLQIEGNVVFNNPEFTLYQAPLKAPIIFSTQLNRFMKKFDEKPSQLNAGHRKFAEQLISLHQTKAPYEKVPTYSYDQLKKGPLCSSCYCFIISTGVKKTRCDICGCVVDNESLIMEGVKELILLFPNNKLTTNYVYDWFNGELSKKQICRILKENYKLVGTGKWTYYK